MAATWDWDDFWSWWEQVDKNVQQDALIQIEARWIVKLSAPHQIEVLKDAPEQVIKDLSKFLHPEACKKLGIKAFMPDKLDIQSIFGTSRKFKF